MAYTKLETMKRRLIFALLIFSNINAYSQSEGNRPISIYEGTTADSEWNAYHPSISDSLNHIFMSIKDSFKSIKGKSIQAGKNSDNTIISYTSGSQIPGSQHPGIIIGNPLEFFCIYQSGKDSAAMFTVFNDLISEVKQCLLRGAFKDVDVMYMQDFNNPRIARFAFFVKELKAGIEPKLKNSSVMIEFDPELSGTPTNNYTIYNVNLIVHL